MLTIILYWNGDSELKLNLDDYDFLFFNTQLQNRLIKKPYLGKVRQTITELRQYTEMIYEWKLILFDGRIVTKNKVKNTSYKTPDTIHREWNGLLYYLSAENNVKLKNIQPKEIWYISCWERGIYTAKNKNEFAHAKLLLNKRENKHFFHNNIKDKYINKDVFDIVNIPFLRVCWTELNIETGIQYRQEELKICCILQILAYNDIPAVFMNNGYLYKININIDSKRFSQYLANFRQYNLELEEQIQKAMEQCYETEHDLVRYIYPDKFSYISPIKFGQYKDLKEEKLNMCDLHIENKLALNRKLQNNWQWINEQVYSVQDYLHKEVTKPVEFEKKNKYKLLNEAGKEDAKLELENAIRTIQLKRQSNESPISIKKGLKNKEKKICDVVDKKLNTSETKFVLFVLALIEGLTFAVFLMRFVKKILKIVSNIIIFIVSIFIISTFTSIILKLISCIYNFMECHCYNSYLKKINKKQEIRIKDVADLIDGIKKYQYHWLLLDRQFEIQEKYEKKKKYLYHHSIVQKNATNICNFLERASEESEYIVKNHTFLRGIDFSSEPEYVEYYPIILSDGSSKISLNNTGYEIDAFFGFISEFEVHITPALQVLYEQDE